MADPLRDWNKGDPLSHSHLQEAVTALRRLLALPGAGVADLTIKSYQWRFRISVGRIVSTGPNGESDYTDSRYWVQRCFLESTAGIDDAITLSDELAGDDTVEGTDGTETVATIFTVTNLTELAARTHDLPVGQFVWYFTVVDGQDDPTPHCLMSESGPPAQIVQVSDVVGCGPGFYHCFPVTRRKDVAVDPSKDLHTVVDDLFITNTYVGSPPPILINMMEANYTNGPRLAISGYYLARFDGQNSNGASVYLCESHAIDDQLVLSGCPRVGSNGTSLEFPTITIGAIRTGTSTACILDGTDCTP